MSQSIRQRKVASSIEQWLHGQIIQESYAKTFEGTRIVAVEMSRDLSLARVWMSAPSGKLSNDQIKAMNALTQTMRFTLAKHICLKKVPTLRFCRDDLTMQQERVGSILNDLFPNGDEESED